MTFWYQRENRGEVPESTLAEWKKQAAEKAAKEAAEKAAFAALTAGEIFACFAAEFSRSNAGDSVISVPLFHDGAFAGRVDVTWASRVLELIALGGEWAKVAPQLAQLCANFYGQREWDAVVAYNSPENKRSIVMAEKNRLAVELGEAQEKTAKYAVKAEAFSKVSIEAEKAAASARARAIKDGSWAAYHSLADAASVASGKAYEAFLEKRSAEERVASLTAKLAECEKEIAEFNGEEGK